MLPDFNDALDETIRFLRSAEVLKAFTDDGYWPKWDGPWWRMALLHEMGATSLIPEAVVDAHIAALNRLPLKIFPLLQDEMPDGVDPFRGTPCHCQLGNVYQVLSARGVDVDAELPWMRPWFFRYQMSDGGLNCDNEAYLVRNETPSSMVGTIAPFEAVLLYSKKPWGSEERNFLEKGAAFLLERNLIFGSQTTHNASERKSAEEWSQLCFPRFYFYDVLRGLFALLKWAELTGTSLPRAPLEKAIALLNEKSKDGVLNVERQAYSGATTLKLSPQGEWLRRQPALSFPLLDKVSAIGVESPYLTEQWRQAREMIARQPMLRELVLERNR